jgi:hypothetical protein
MLLALLALALPTAALADSISNTGDSTITTGKFVTGAIGLCTSGGCMTLGNPLTITIEGLAATVTITSTLSPATCGGTGTCDFSGGSAAVSRGHVKITFTLLSGSFMKNGRTGSGFTAQLSNGGSVSITPFVWTGNGSMNFGQNDDLVATVTIPSVPEPGTLGLLELGLLGNGVIGLVGIARRKLKLGR